MYYKTNFLLVLEMGCILFFIIFYFGTHDFSLYHNAKYLMNDHELIFFLFIATRDLFIKFMIHVLAFEMFSLIISCLFFCILNLNYNIGFGILEMINEEVSAKNIKFSIRKKEGVKFKLDTESIRQISHTPEAEKRHSEIKFKNLASTANGKSRHLRKYSNTQNTQRLKNRYSQSQDDEIRIALNDIQQRGATFYKLGFLSVEKKGKKRKKFSDFFNLKFEQVKGTMTIGELWSGKQRSNFLKQNKIYINKVKLIQKINQIRKQNDIHSKRFCSANTLASSYPHFYTSSNLGTLNNISQEQFDKQNVEQGLLTLRKKAAKLHRGAQKEEISHMLKCLEANYENIQKLEKKYFFKLLQML